MRESKIQKTILDYLAGVPHLYVVNFVGSAVTAKGTPDILACMEGKFVALEVKREDSSYDVTHAQRGRIKRIRKAGGKAYVVESLQDVVKIVEGIQHGFN